MPLDQLRSAKNKVIGAKEVLKAVENKGATLVFVAEDADAKVVKPIEASCVTRGVEMESVSSKSRLGEACGIDVGAAVAAILKD